MAENWGYKVTYYVYMEGFRESSKQVLEGADKLAEVFPDYNFVGAKIDIVPDEPHDQVAS